MSLGCAISMLLWYAGSADQTVKLWSLSGQATPDEEGEAPIPSASPELQLLKSFRTRVMPVFSLHWTPRNLLLAAGAMAPTKLR